MTIELRPLGVACNLSCHYCYQNPQRDAGNQRMSYDLAKMKAAAVRIGGPFVLFGGEPLLMRFEDLEDIFTWGLEAFGGSTIQTNGVLIEDRHIELFKRCKVSVGVSIDGPGELNDTRWRHTLEKTRESTAAVERAIERLCREYKPPGLIITLHKANASADKLPAMTDWMRRLYDLGIRGVRLHLLEVDDESIRDRLALSHSENIHALLAFAEVHKTLPGMHLDLFEEMEGLLRGKDSGAGCTWRGCDPYTTEAVQGVEGNGQSSNCGRTNKEGIGFIKAETAGYERYLSLYRTPQSDNGCSGCRFFLMCKGQCPGTSIDHDWRNRTEHCEEWKHLFNIIEQRMILAGEVPLTIQPVRLEIERRMIEAWRKGKNPSINRTLAEWQEELTNTEITQSSSASPAAGLRPRVRISWVSERAGEIWRERLQRLIPFIEEMTVHAACANPERCTVRLVPELSLPRLMELAKQYGLSTATLPREALPSAIATQPEADNQVIFLCGELLAVEAARAAWSEGNSRALRAAIDLPSCCANRAEDLYAHTLFHQYRGVLSVSESVTSHPLLAPFGISILPVAPCSLDCTAAQEASDRWLELAAVHDYADEVAWLRECLSWAIVWSELHGATEIKTPVLKACFESGSSLRPLHIRRAGTAAVEGATTGLSFPYAAPPSHARLVTIGA
jgi:uncharacterized protein